MEELTSTVQTSAANAREADSLACKASEVAESGGSAMGQVVSTVQQIQAS